jgi:hypothetical protein
MSDHPDRKRAEEEIKLLQDDLPVLLNPETLESFLLLIKHRINGDVMCHAAGMGSDYDTLISIGNHLFHMFQTNPELIIDFIEQLRAQMKLDKVLDETMRRQ